MQGGAGFSNTEVQALQPMTVAIARGLHTCFAREFHSGAVEGPAPGNRQAVVVLADDFSLISQTASAAPWL